MNNYEEKGDILKYLRKTMLIMRLSLFLMVISTALAFSSNSYSQNTKLTLDLNNVTIKEVIKAIEGQSEFLFFYQHKHLDLERRISLHATEQNVQEILNELFAGTNNIYFVNDRQVIIREALVAELEKKLDKLDGNKPILFSQSQQNVVKGRVYDKNGEPLPGVTIIILGTTRGVITDNDGTYSIEAQPTDKLVFSSLGMESQIVDVGNRTTINIELGEKIDELAEVTVVAFGKQKKESVIGSISTINPGELRVSSSNLTTALAGRVAGIISYQRSGEPGQDNAAFFVRGVTTFGYKKDPLILIDGIELTSDDLARLQTDDIASFSIMKDATATALYGARGANGVILVTTKEGKEGKAKISFRA